MSVSSKWCDKNQSEMDEIWGCRASGQGSLLLLVSGAQGRHRS